ncbi:phosphorylase [Leptospira levettii]|uniref:phosphorylase n=1 Tax=Leptospira levettii TaxID=2023178 RepID=UPI0010829F5E|nr:phosphorylase [Leptospira levettii]MCW7508726.1 phosphorylase [Leptospira levettii]MCW7519816.1 phosphorylase [Leptospira levettii]TGK97896.1 phosphorylase [Leptospira levettii]
MLPFNPKQTLVTGAFEGEVNLLKNHPRFPYVKEMGIGNLEQAVQLFAYLNQNPQIQNIVFLGSCGVYPWSKTNPNTIVSPNVVCSLELSASLGFTKQLPQSPLSFPLVADPMFASGICNAPTCITLQTMDSPPEGNWRTLSFENLELFGLTKVANEFKIPVTAYLAVTNIVGPQGSTEWVQNWRELSNKLQSYFLPA